MLTCLGSYPLFSSSLPDPLAATVSFSPPSSSASFSSPSSSSVSSPSSSEASDREVTQRWAGHHLQIGIESMLEIGHRGEEIRSRAPLTMAVPLWILAAANVVFFFDLSPVLELARAAAEAAFAGGIR